MLCGLTRDVRAFLATGGLPDPPGNPRAPTILLLFAIEAVFRLFAVFLARGASLRSWLLADAGLHGAMGVFLALRW